MIQKIERALCRLEVLKRGANPYYALAAFFLTLHIFTDFTAEGFITQVFRQIILFAAFCLVAFGAYLYLTGRLTTGRAAALIIIAGVLVRVSYIFCTNVYSRQHDIYEGDQTGHIGYILRLAKTGTLPDSNAHQLYHPPLHYMISAALFRLNSLFKMSEARNLESLQFLTAFYISCISIISYRIFKKLKLTGRFLLAATALTALHPTFFILAGSVNNDALFVTLSVASLLWLMNWQENQSMENTIKFALCVGFAVMTKTGGATLAFSIGPIFIAKLFSHAPEASEDGKFSPKFKIILKLALFGLISLPIGLWFPIRNLKAFGQPFDYVLHLDLNGPLYVGDYSIVKRMLSFSVSQLLVRLYPAPFEDYNLPVYILKSSLFGEYIFNDGLRSVAAVLIALNFILIIASLAATVYVIVSKRPRGDYVWAMFAMWVVQIAAFIFFNIKYPFGATMDFRYIVPTPIIGAGFIGIALQHISNKNIENKKIAEQEITEQVITGEDTANEEILKKQIEIKKDARELYEFLDKFERRTLAVCALFGAFSVLFYLFI